MNNNNNKKNAFSFKNMTDIQKKSLLKLLGILAVIIAVFTIFAKSSIFNGDTLAEYAQKYPDLAYGESVSESEADNGE